MGSKIRECCIERLCQDMGYTREQAEEMLKKLFRLVEDEEDRAKMVAATD